MSAFRRKLTHLLILDFEATCGDGIRVQLNNQEIIEFPTILYNLSSRTVEGTFHEYIRPVRVPTLTTFCTELTGIEQPTVDAADPFPTVWGRFETFMRTHNLLDSRTYAFVTCGDWDLKTMLPAQLKLSSELDAAFTPNSSPTTSTELSLTPVHFDRRINIKKTFSRHMPGRSGARKSLGMAGMLSKSGLTLEGRHHSGIDDSKNILRIAQKLIEVGWTPTEEDVRLP